MKKISILLVIILLTSACSKTDDGDPQKGLCVKLNDSVVLTHSDIDYYDFSSHIMYLKRSNPFPKEIMAVDTFTVLADGQEIYSGKTWPIYLSSLPSGVFVNSPTFYPDYILKIDYSNFFYAPESSQSDPRVDSRIVNALKRFKQHRAGLSCEIKSIQQEPSGTVTLAMELTNNDLYNYYYLDPGKMGLGLYHYFTNGLTLLGNDKPTLISHLISAVQPDPYDIWKKEWLSVIKGNETKTIKIVYQDFEHINPGQYKARFIFPGLSYQVKKNQLRQEQGYIWLGELVLNADISIN